MIVNVLGPCLEVCRGKLTENECLVRSFKKHEYFANNFRSVPDSTISDT
jgi:hypothetical protein